MEKSIVSFTESLNQTFGLSAKDWKMYSPLTLAYIGDAAYELVIRSIYVERSNCQAQKLHQKVTAKVSAKAQAQMARALQEQFTEEETGFFRRGRNSRPNTKAKNATMREYLDATGFEAVIGFLYLEQRFERMNELIAAGLAALEQV